ncbi:MAG: hypothetical protein Q8P48_01955 [Deltaproteobacteria bacterium]|nr:hypothetical protein [Deltaproteobacteria bacterium]
MIRKLPAFFLLFVLLLTGSAAFAEGVAVVRSEGVSLRTDNAAEVKKKAIDQALKNAVTSSLTRLMKDDGIEDFSIAESGVLSDPSSYILNYRILSEGWITHMDSIPPLADKLPDIYGQSGQNPGGLELYHIWIEASVDSSRLHNALSRLTAPQDRPAAAVTLNIVGVTDYAAFRAILSSIERIPAVKDISYSSFYRGRIALALKSTGDGQTLTEKIAKEIPGGFAVIPGGPKMIIIRAASNR